MNDTWEDLAEQHWLDDNISQVLLDKINIIDILNKWRLRYSQCVSGDFEYRMKCPLPNHKFGDERTASMFVSPKENSFYCFGCNHGGNVITFVSLYKGIPYYESIKYLLSLLNIDNKSLNESNSLSVEINPEHKVFTHIFRAGVCIRDFLSNHKDSSKYGKLCKWADREFLELDCMLDNLSNSDWEVAKEYHTKISNKLKEIKI